MKLRRAGLRRCALERWLAAICFCGGAWGGWEVRAQSLSPEAGSSFEQRFRHPPAERRILKIIHSWPDDFSAQDSLIESLQSQGFGGVVCNVSFTEYLESETRWKALERAVERAKKAGFSLWVYDEKGYPSATAGGLVLRNHPEWQARGLLITEAQTDVGPVELELPPGDLKLAAAYPVQNGHILLGQMTNLARLVHSEKLSWNAPRGKWKLLAITEDRLFEGTHASMSLSVHIPYPNLLDPEPTARFLELTHQAYAQHLGPDLGRFFVSTFTDEPSLMSLFLRPMPYRVLPWSTKFAAEFHHRRGYDLLPRLALLALDGGPDTGRTRYDYWQTVGELVSENYFGQIERWCAAHHLDSGGHLLMEENLVAQVPLYGDFFKCLRRMDAPGIDCLTSIPAQVPWFIARLAGSAADLQGSSVTMCETSDHSQHYRPPGDKRPRVQVTPAEIRGTCNRLILGGIDTITSYYSFDGLKNDDLKMLNDYVGRCCAAVQGGHQVCDVAVVYPAQSVWPRFRPSRHNATDDSPGAARIENAFHDVSDGLFASARDFTYIDAQALLESKVDADALKHGELRWRVIVLPGVDTLPLAIWEKLARFVAQGGVWIQIGTLPTNSETEFPSLQVQDMAAQIFGRNGTGADQAPRLTAHAKNGAAVFIPFGMAGTIGTVLKNLIDPDFTARPAGSIRYTHRRISGREIYFVINDSPEPWSGDLEISARGAPIYWNPQSGDGSKLTEGNPLRTQIEGYAATVISFTNALLPARHSGSGSRFQRWTIKPLPSVAAPVIARGEFVREQISPGPRGEWFGSSGTSTAATQSWRITGKLTKGGVDTFLFARFTYKHPLDLHAEDNLVVDSWVPPEQASAAQLLVILHEKDGADYLALTGRQLNAPGSEQSWVPLNRFQLAGWSADSDGKLDPDKITEIRIGWGGYYGTEGEAVEVGLAPPEIAATEN